MRSLSTRAFSTLAVLVVLFVASRAAFAQCDSGTICTCPDCPLKRSYKQARWHIVETENFQVCSDESPSRAESLAKHAEILRSELRSNWLPNDSDEAWTPKCQIVLHGERRSYVSAVGRGSERTVGSSLVTVDKGKILSRKVDLLDGKTEFFSAALPHELTHVVVNEAFAKSPMPRWADEGIAILADPDAKQVRHRQDLRKALANGTTFQTVSLLTHEDYPRPDRFGVFYGQSASLAEFLVKRKSPEAFISFVKRAALVGYDSALRSTYDIVNVRELDRKWRESLSPVLLSYSSAH